jgi:hypothetical protein
MIVIVCSVVGIVLSLRNRGQSPISGGGWRVC